MSKIFEWDRKVDGTPVEKQLILGFQDARNKIIKYYHKTNWIYAAVLILDPRHKLEAFDMTSWGQELKRMSVQTFEDIYKGYFNESERQRNKEKVLQRKDREPKFNNFVIESDALYETKSTPC